VRLVHISPRPVASRFATWCASGLAPWFAIWCSFGATHVQSQSPAPVGAYPVAVVVRGRAQEPVRCFDAEPLQQRIAHYRGTQTAQAGELRFELHIDDLDTAELRVFRREHLVSRRRFEHLPAACADRRDAVALSIALALEGAARAQPQADEAPSAQGASAAGAASTDTNIPSATVAGTSSQQRTTQEVEETRRESAPAPSEPPVQPPAADTTADARASADESLADSAREPQDSAEDAPEAADAVEAGEAGKHPLLELHVGGRWLNQALPSPVWTGTLGVAFWLNRQLGFDISAIASTAANSAFPTAAAPGARVETRLIGGELLGCTGWSLAGVVAQGCLGATAASCRARGIGFPAPVEPSEKSLLWAAGAARFAVRWPDESLIAVRLVLQAQVNLVRPELRIAGASQLLYPSWVGGSAGVDMILALE